MITQSLIASKMATGFTFTASIGPITVQMFNRGLTNGFSAAFMIRIGAVITSIICMLVAFLGITNFIKLPLVTNIMLIIGCVFLIYLGIANIFGKNTESTKIELIFGSILCMANPATIDYWLNLGAKPNLIENSFILLGVIAWGAALSCILTVCKQLLSNKTIKFLSISSGIVLIYFAVVYGSSLIL